MTQSTGENWKRWIGIGLLLLGWFASAAWFSSAYATRLAILEKSNEEKVSRQEFNDLKERLGRIEDKLDRALRRP